MSSPLRLVVLIRTQPGMRERQLRAFVQLAPVVRAEEGCLQYDLHETSEPDRFVLLERWESPEALAMHNAAAHMAAADAANGAFRAGPAEVLMLSDDSSA
ncbi:MAG: antibiotic biosynthesis monooxygenase family protein [Umezawaea sp.]